MTAPLTDADIAAARALAEGATPGPWARYRRGKTIAVYQGTPRPGGREVVGWPGFDDSSYPVAEHAANAAFIAAARTLVPRLCDAVEEARRERDALARQRVGFIQAGTLDTNEQRVRAETAERERDEARARVAKLEAGIKACRMLEQEPVTPGLGMRLAAAEATLDALLSPTPDLHGGRAYRVALSRGTVQQADVANESALPSPEATPVGKDRKATEELSAPEATPFEADTMAHEDAPCGTCGGLGSIVSDHRVRLGIGPIATVPCPACAKGAR